MATIGEILRRERARKGLTLQEIEQSLHIRAAYLEALEEDNYEVIPGHVYVKGFIRNYGNFLGLDGQGLVLTYKDHIGEDRAFVVRTSKSKLKKTTNSQRLMNTDKIQKISIETRQRKREKTIIQERIFVTMIVIVIVIFFVWLLIL